MKFLMQNGLICVFQLLTFTLNRHKSLEGTACRSRSGLYMNCSPKSTHKKFDELIYIYLATIERNNLVKYTKFTQVKLGIYWYFKIGPFLRRHIFLIYFHLQALFSQKNYTKPISSLSLMKELNVASIKISKYEIYFFVGLFKKSLTAWQDDFAFWCHSSHFCIYCLKYIT